MLKTAFLFRTISAAGIVALVYYIFDLAFPCRFVGDMYGLEVLVRFVYLLFPIGLGVLGILLYLLGRTTHKKILDLAGKFLLSAASVIIISMAVHASHSRYIWRIRESYPQRNVEELLKLATEKKDQFAIYALGDKHDPEAVPGLCSILLNENEQVTLRSCAAHALGEIGGQQAKQALEQTLASKPHENLKIAVEYALNVRMNTKSISCDSFEPNSVSSYQDQNK